MPSAYYDFDENGRMIMWEKDGLVAENGDIYYFVRDVKTYAGLMKSAYYQFDDQGRMILD